MDARTTRQHGADPRAKINLYRTHRVPIVGFDRQQAAEDA